MQTRSKTKLTNQGLLVKKSILEVNIDFNDAIIEWNKNKKSIGNGHYKYICTNKSQTGVCGKACYKDKDKCWIHRNK